MQTKHGTGPSTSRRREGGAKTSPHRRRLAKLAAAAPPDRRHAPRVLPRGARAAPHAEALVDVLRRLAEAPLQAAEAPPELVLGVEARRRRAQLLRRVGDRRGRLFVELALAHEVARRARGAVKQLLRALPEVVRAAAAAGAAAAAAGLLLTLSAGGDAARHEWPPRRRHQRAAAAGTSAAAAAACRGRRAQAGQ